MGGSLPHSVDTGLKIQCLDHGALREDRTDVQRC